MNKKIISLLISVLLLCLNYSCEKEKNNDKLIWQSYTSEHLLRNYMRTITIDSDDNKWIGTDFGLLKFKDDEWTLYDGRNSIRSIVIDDHGIKWIGSVNLWAESTVGLSTFNNDEWTTKVQWSSYALAIDAEGQKWIGTESGELLKFNNDILTVFPKKYINNVGFCINSIAIDLNDNKWICSDRGILKFDKNQLWTTVNDTLAGNSVVIDANNIWIGSSKGLLYYDGSNWTSYDKSNGLIDNYITALVIDNFGSIWIGTRNGLSKFNGSMWESFLKGEFIRALAVDKNDELWVCTDDELLKYNASH